MKNLKELKKEYFEKIAKKIQKIRTKFLKNFGKVRKISQNYKKIEKIWYKI